MEHLLRAAPESSQSRIFKARVTNSLSQRSASFTSQPLGRYKIYYLAILFVSLKKKKKQMDALNKKML